MDSVGLYAGFCPPRTVTNLAVATIYLGPSLPTASSNLPQALGGPPYATRSCSGGSLPSGAVTRAAGELLPHLYLTATVVYFSVALSLRIAPGGCPAHHPALGRTFLERFRARPPSHRIRTDSSAPGARGAARVAPCDLVRRRKNAPASGALSRRSGPPGLTPDRRSVAEALVTRSGPEAARLRSRLAHASTCQINEALMSAPCAPAASRAFSSKLSRPSPHVPGRVRARAGSPPGLFGVLSPLTLCPITGWRWACPCPVFGVLSTVVGAAG